MRIGARGTPPFGGFYENSVPIFQERKAVPVEEADLLPSGVVTARVLHGLANKLNQIDTFSRRHGNTKPPYLRLIQSGSDGRVTALVQSGNMTLKLVLRRNASSTGEEEWIVLGDALKVSD